MEYMDYVDKDDNVLGRKSREEIYNKKFRHRIVHVMVFNRVGKLLLHKRSANVSHCPSHWDTSAGGHVSSGETYLQAAGRELEEELGIESALEFKFKDEFIGEEKVYKFLVIFHTIFAGELKLNPREVESVKFFTFPEIKELIESGGKIHPELLFLLNKHYL